MDMLDNSEFEDKAWGNMLELLGKEMPQRKVFPWKWMIGLVVFLFLLGTGVFMNYYDRADGGMSGLDQHEATLFLDSGNSEKALTHEFSNVVSKELINEEIAEQLVQTSGNTKDEITTKIQHVNKNSQEKSIHLNVAYSQTINAASSTQDSNLSQDQAISLNSNGQNNPSLDIVNMEVVSSVLASTESISSEMEVPGSVVYEEENKLTFENEENRDIKFDDFLSNKRIVPFDIKINAKAEFNKDVKLDLFTPSLKTEVNIYAFGEMYYLTDFGTLSQKIGLLIEGKKSISPWSFSTGLSYERNHFKKSEIRSLNKESDMNGQELINEDMHYTNKSNESSSISYIDYINIPMMVHYRMNRMKIGLGVENSFRMTSKFFEKEFPINAESLEEKKSTFYQYSLVQGLSYRVGNRLDVGLKSSLDLSGIFKKETIQGNEYLHNIAVSVAYKLN